jgi:hypothetical protein
VSDILRDDLAFDLLDPAVNVVDALFVQHAAVGIEQALTLRGGRVTTLVIDKRQVTLIMTDLQTITFSGKSFAGLVQFG